MSADVKPDVLEQQLAALRRAADLFHEIGSAQESKRLLDREGHKLTQVMYDDFTAKLRSSDEIKALSAAGFELCVLALAASGAADVTIHECGKSALGEEPWDDREAARCTGALVHDSLTPCPVHDLGEGEDLTRCTGTLLHGEFTSCPAHDRRGR